MESAKECRRHGIESSKRKRITRSHAIKGTPKGQALQPPTQ
ncbi:hypothetical protein OROGR_012017 [Orobanche gracilis]